MLVVGVLVWRGWQFKLMLASRFPPRSQRTIPTNQSKHNANRSLGRNVRFFDARVADIAEGGLLQNGSVTEANFLDYLRILLVAKTPLGVRERTSGHIVMMTDNRLECGESVQYSLR